MRNLSNLIIQIINWTQNKQLMKSVGTQYHNYNIQFFPNFFSRTFSVTKQTKTRLQVKKKKKANHTRKWEITLSHEASGSNSLANLNGDKWPFWCCCWPFNFRDFPSFILGKLEESINGNQVKTIRNLWNFSSCRELRFKFDSTFAD